MKHAQRTEKYIRLIFNSYFSDYDFFLKVHAHYRHELVFSADFQGQEECALCTNAHYATLNTVDFGTVLTEWYFFYFFSAIYQSDFGTVQTEWYFFILFLQFIS